MSVLTVASNGAYTSPFTGSIAIPFPNTSEANVSSPVSDNPTTFPSTGESTFLSSLALFTAVSFKVSFSTFLSSSFLFSYPKSHVRTNATPAAIKNIKIYLTGAFRQRRIPKIPVTPVPVAPRDVIDANIAPHPPPIQAQINGLKNLIFTPKIAGSVIPINADKEDGNAIAFNFWSLVFNATANAAAPCAIFAADASGSQYVQPNSLICPRSIIVYI